MKMRKIIACEFMTLDGVIQNEENDGDGFKYGGWFFPYADERPDRMQLRVSKISPAAFVANFGAIWRGEYEDLISGDSVGVRN